MLPMKVQSEIIIEGLMQGAPLIIFFKSLAARNQFLPGKHSIPFIDAASGPLKSVVDAPPDGDKKNHQTTSCKG